MFRQVALSGNVGVGKSTIGPILAEALGAPWLPETEISDLFPHLIAEQDANSKMIAEIVFPSAQVASLLSRFLGGASTVVTERSTWDHSIFFDLWRRRFSFPDRTCRFMAELAAQLHGHPLNYLVLTVVLQARTEELAGRVARRGQTFDPSFDIAVLQELQSLYARALDPCPGHVIAVHDVTDLDLRDAVQVKGLVGSILTALETHSAGNRHGQL